ncbi:MAG: glycosyltransferase family 4 protein [Oscillochloris sp.]|nr:glycosyltransferase family 4 protein [Oscillochloris sp.]
MRILQVTSGYSPQIGGVESHVQEISVALARLGHSVTVATEQQMPGLLRCEIIQGITIQRFPAVGKDILRYPSGMLRYLQTYARTFDVIHAHNFHALPFLIASFVCPEQLILTLHYHGRGHSQLASLIHRIYDPATRPLIQRARHIVCVSEAEAALVQQTFGIRNEKITILPNIVPLVDEVMLDDMLATQNSSRAPTQLLAVGRLEPYKRVDRIIEALPYLPNDYTLTLIGTGPDRDRLETLAEQRSVHARVHFAGRVDDAELRCWYRRAAAVVSLSEVESFGRTVLEGVASGCQVVCSDIPAYRRFAQEFPHAISLVSQDTTGAQIADILYNTADRLRHRPETIDLRQYTSHTIIKDLLAIYRQATY